MNSIFSGKKIVLGVTGSIAAYKAADLASKLTQLGAEVRVILTANGLEFVGAATFRAITGNNVLTGIFDETIEGEIAHIAVIQQADLLLIAPATGNIIGKIANGIADDMLTTLAMAADCPVIIAPAMNTVMWQSPFVQANVDKLKSAGYHFVTPAEGRLACGAEGIGKLAPVECILDTVESALLGVWRDLEGINILVTAGPTREAIDPVRYISNRSTGRMGFAIARAAALQGASVTLVTGPVEKRLPIFGVDVIEVESAGEMLEAVRASAVEARVVIATAAVSDFSPKAADQKIKRSKIGSSFTLELTETADILGELGKNKGDKILVGFALETDNLELGAKEKLKQKNLDVILANWAGGEHTPFGDQPARVRVFTSDGEDHAWPPMTKDEAAFELLTFIRSKYLAEELENRQWEI